MRTRDRRADNKAGSSQLASNAAFAETRLALSPFREKAPVKEIIHGRFYGNKSP